MRLRQRYSTYHGVEPTRLGVYDLSLMKTIGDGHASRALAVTPATVTTAMLVMTDDLLCAYAPTGR